jgi:AraC family transcriptional regulator of adaptative response/methylated-DNA-[protein]-cysteine methyltransferase
MTDYQKIAKAIEFIQRHQKQQPTLKEIAAEVHLSPFHFQRVFSRWAGVTPKRFLQVLTLQQAKQLLNEKNSTLHTANELGLSSSSRVYDHFVQLEAVTPSEYKQAGKGLNINYGYHETIYGTVFIAVTARGICKLSFVNNTEDISALNELNQEWPQASIIKDQNKTKNVITAIFDHTSSPNKPISLWVKGTNFQINVWRALLNINTGQLASYSQLATQINKPTAARAVGTAIGGNPIALVIPCHRVIQQSGELGGYRWGETRKHAILSRELSRIDLLKD